MPGFKDEDLKKEFSLILNKSIKTFFIRLYWAFFLIFLHFFQIYLIPWTVRWLRYLDTDIYHNILTNSHLNKFLFNPIPPRCGGGGAKHMDPTLRSNYCRKRCTIDVHGDYFLQNELYLAILWYSMLSNNCFFLCHILLYHGI